MVCEDNEIEKKVLLIEKELNECHSRIVLKEQQAVKDCMDILRQLKKSEGIMGSSGFRLFLETEYDHCVSYKLKNQLQKHLTPQWSVACSDYKGKTEVWFYKQY
eukprot:TRINITY_DN13955_c0_g1_i1.p1 TRINITY_DN13955_c0_g1~~TRINITY_DN13955_c0_g1_i1.p1  ORF type:complete len:104 (-),score=5.55 TRINITY_DN13955_c0_g1_i1:160-471(-)